MAFDAGTVGQRPVAVAAAPPVGITAVSALLVLNLALSVGVTIASLTHIDELIRVALAHQNTQGLQIDTLRESLRAGLYGRAVANVVVAVVYAFLIRGLRAGKRRAWRRAARLSTLGAVGLVYLLTRPYPAAFKAEQVVQVVVLGAVAAILFSPAMRAHFRTPAPAATAAGPVDPVAAARAWAAPEPFDPARLNTQPDNGSQ